jgi:hypothetical protein
MHSCCPKIYDVSHVHSIQNLETTVPFFVGVIGHRHLRLEEIPRLQQEFDSHIKSLLGSLKATKIIVLTGIAEGADRIPQTSQYREHFSICAVLPMEKIEYAKDFPSKKERSAFQEALNQCEYMVVSPHSPTGRLSIRLRDKAYQECARWISDNSNLLIGFWDGLEPRGVAGTSETVNYRTSEVYAKPSAREKESEFLHIQASNGERNFKENCTCTGHKVGSTKHKKFIDELDNLNSLMEPSKTRPEGDQLKLFFTQFDISATTLQKRFNRRTISLFAWALITLQLAFIQQQTFSLLWLSLSALTMIVTLTLWWSLWKLRIKSAYETFRFVAELLRIQNWWNECGLKVNALHDNVEYHDIKAPTYSLLKNIFVYSTMAQPDSPKAIKQVKKESSERVESKWIEDQIRYLIGSETKLGAIERNRIAAKRGLLFMILSLALAGIIQIFSTVISWLDIIKTGSVLDLALKFIFPFLLSIAASVAAYAKLMGYKEVKILYDLKLRRLEIALAQLSRLELKSDSALIVKSVGNASLTESLRWFQLKGDREIRPFQS